MDTTTHYNLVTAENRELEKALWAAINNWFASSHTLDQAREFNNFLYLIFKEDKVKYFVIKAKVPKKKLTNLGMDLPNDTLAYLILFEFPLGLQALKKQIMHLYRDISVEHVLKHLTQHHNKHLAESKGSSDKKTLVICNSRPGQPGLRLN